MGGGSRETAEGRESGGMMEVGEAAVEENEEERYGCGPASLQGPAGPVGPSLELYRFLPSVLFVKNQIWCEPSGPPHLLKAHAEPFICCTRAFVCT